MSKKDSPAEEPRRDVSRRVFLGMAGVGAGAFVAGTATGAGVVGSNLNPAGLSSDSHVGSATVPFYGKHQAGIETPFQSHGVFLGFNLKHDAIIDSAIRMMKLLTDDAARLTQGEPALPDNDPYLATTPARLTVTFGFGPGFFSRLGLSSQMPVGFVPLPAFSIDALQPEYSGGDVLIQIGADDPLTLSHATRQLTRTARSFADIQWSQSGFVRAQGVAPDTQTPRNLFGQVDGTVNPRTPEQFDAQVWANKGPAWFHGGTQMVLRRIAMNLDTWDKLDDGGKELSIGRKLSNGAPLTGKNEFDAPDFEATTPTGLKVIPRFAHIRRARTEDPRQKFLRRPLSYDEGIGQGGTPDVGLLFAAYMANIEYQYVPVQQQLADLDLLNTWTTPIGSAVFAIPPGCQPGGFIGEGLLT